MVGLAGGAIGGAGYLAGKRNPVIADDIGAADAEGACPPELCAGLEGTRGVLEGDSHASRIVDVLRAQAGRVGISIVGEDRAPPDAAFAILVRRWVPIFERDGAAMRARLEADVEALGDGGRRRLLILAPVPDFPLAGAECVLRADRYGIGRDRCGLPRRELEERRAGAVAALREVAEGRSNVRLVDPIDFFCDAEFCRPVRDGILLTKDDNHLTDPNGAWRFFAHYREAFWWAFSGRDATGG